jgi:arylsulfatase
MTRKHIILAALCGFITTAFAATPDDGSVLPFPPPPLSDCVATPRLQDAKMKWPAQPQRLPKDAPNILIVLLDDIGFGVAETFGGEVHTATLTKLAGEGLRYNCFHTTSICSPTRDSCEQSPFPFNEKMGATHIKCRKE